MPSGPPVLSTVCPADCIYVRGADNPPDAPISPGERYGFVYEINMLRCMFCGYCEEACPTGARVFGNLLDPKSEIRYVLENKAVFRLKEELGTEPKFWYFRDA